MAGMSSDGDQKKPDARHSAAGSLPPFLRGGSWEAMAINSGGGGGTKVARVWGVFMDQLARNPKLWMDVVRDTQQRQCEMLAAMATPVPGLPKDGKKAPPKKEAPSPDRRFAPHRGEPDRRFAAPEWHENPFFRFLMQNYRLTSDAVRILIARVPMDPDDKKLLLFTGDQYLSAISPANFPATNPEVINATIESGGDNLIAGVKNIIRDLESGIVSNTDRDAFTIGKNLATTPGKVVAQNGAMQLIEYAPQTKSVYAKPVLIIPPFINKYYILDLQRHNSLVRHLTDGGFRVFLVSWINAGAREAQLEWDDYLALGVLDPIAAVADITGQAKIHITGYCVGGTLLASALAMLAAEGRQPAASLTLLTTMLDFGDTGDLAVFVDDAAVADYERRFAKGGLMDGADVARTFAMLRPNDLVWPYVVSNYYKGEKPAAFDMLYWNSDSTNLPGKMFAYYLRATYLQNDLAAGRCEMRGTKIDLGKIAAPAFIIACERDHIVPWKTAYQSARLLSSAVDFVLGAAGHVAGVVNPPAQAKGAYRTAANPAKKGSAMPQSADEWRSHAKVNEGSWWTKWTEWLAGHDGGKQVKAPAAFGNYRYRPMQNAPGSYVTAPRPSAAVRTNHNTKREKK
jgi:polyhydroxyalkanoate synthase